MLSTSDSSEPLPATTSGSGSFDDRAVGSRSESCSGSPVVVDRPLFLFASAFLRLTAPLDGSEEEGRLRFGRCVGVGVDEDLPRLVERERRELIVSTSLSGPVTDSSPSVQDSLPDAERKLERELCIGVSGTGISVSTAGGLGGGRSGPSTPPMLGTPGSAVRILSTSSSEAMMNWTNAHVDH